MQQKTAKLSMFSIITYSLTRGRIQMNNADDPAGILELTTKGRKSGKSRSVPLGYVKRNSSFAVAATNAGRDKHPGWYFNLRSNPDVEIRIKDQHFRATAEISGPEQRNQLWQQLVMVAPFYTDYEKRTHRQIPMILLHPV